MPQIVCSHLGTFQKVKDSYFVSVCTVRETFSSLTGFIGWEELCESRPEAKVPHLFHHWQMRAFTRYEYFWLLKLSPWNSHSPGALPALFSSHTSHSSIWLHQAQVSLLTQALPKLLQRLSLLLASCVVSAGWRYLLVTTRWRGGDFRCPLHLELLENWD